MKTRLSLHDKSEKQAREQAIAAFHPGPGPDWKPPAEHRLSAPARLAQTETRLVDLVIERFADRNGDLGDLARSVIVQRAHRAN